jgi:hypothetical protein
VKTVSEDSEWGRADVECSSNNLYSRLRVCERSRA